MVDTLEKKDVKVKLIGVTPEEVVKATNEGLTAIQDDLKKQEIVNLIKEGKTQEMQVKLWMIKDNSVGLEKRADGKLGEKTLANLKAGKVVEARTTKDKNTQASLPNPSPSPMDSQTIESTPVEALKSNEVFNMYVTQLLTAMKKTSYTPNTGDVSKNAAIKNRLEGNNIFLKKLDLSKDIKITRKNPDINISILGPSRFPITFSMNLIYFSDKRGDGNGYTINLEKFYRTLDQKISKQIADEKKIKEMATLDNNLDKTLEAVRKTTYSMKDLFPELTPEMNYPEYVAFFKTFNKNNSKISFNDARFSENKGKIVFSSEATTEQKGNEDESFLERAWRNAKEKEEDAEPTINYIQSVTIDTKIVTDERWVFKEKNFKEEIKKQVQDIVDKNFVW